MDQIKVQVYAFFQIFVESWMNSKKVSNFITMNVYKTTVSLDPVDNFLCLFQKRQTSAESWISLKMVSIFITMNVYKTSVSLDQVDNFFLSISEVTNLSGKLDESKKSE